MKWKSFLMIIIISLMPLGLLFTAGCMEKSDSGKIGVIVTIPPQIEMVEAVGGEKIDCTVMVPVGKSPHTFSPEPKQMIAVADAKVYFKVGSGVEFELNYMETLKRQNSQMKVFDCSEGITIKSLDEHYGSEHYHESVNASTEDDYDHDHTSDDPHIWLSVRNAKIMVRNICSGLIEVDSENKEYYEKNRDSYLSQLDVLYNETKARLKPFEGRAFLAYHSSWGYLGDDYNLVQLAIEEGGKKPGPAGVTAIIDQAKEQNIKVVFVSPQFETSSAKTIAKEINGEVVFVDPLGDSYLDNIREISNKLAEGFLK